VGQRGGVVPVYAANLTIRATPSSCLCVKSIGAYTDTTATARIPYNHSKSVNGIRYTKKWGEKESNQFLYLGTGSHDFIGVHIGDRPCIDLQAARDEEIRSGEYIFEVLRKTAEWG
jgi:hypothetical protein